VRGEVTGDACWEDSGEQLQKVQKKRKKDRQTYLNNRAKNYESSAKEIFYSHWRTDNDQTDGRADGQADARMDRIAKELN
jgi:hypothetical protein